MFVITHSSALSNEGTNLNCVFFFQAEDGIRDGTVTGVQTCALPISHSCRSPASVACCSGSIVPVVLPAPNTGLRQPHEQAAWTPPSPTSWMVVWCSTATGLLQVSDRAGQRPPHAVEGLDSGGCQLAQLVDVWRRYPRDDVVGPGHARRLRDARHVPQRRSHGGRLARFGLDQNVCGDHVTTTRPSP